MTYEKAEFIARVMGRIIKHNLVTGGNANETYNDLEPEVKTLVRATLNHREKRALGIVPNDEPDPLEMALRTRTRERQEDVFGTTFDAKARLKTRTAELYYDTIKAA
jgi:hypothetical protein